VAVAQLVGVAESLSRGEEVADREDVPLRVGKGLPLADVEALAVPLGVKEGEPEAVGGGESVGVAVPFAVAVPGGVAVVEPDKEPVASGVKVGVVGAEGLVVALPPVGELLRGAEGEALRDSRAAEGDWVEEGVTVPPPRGLAVGETVAEGRGDDEPELVSKRDGDTVGVAVPPPPAEVEGDPVCVMEREGEPVSERVPVVRALREGETDTEREIVAVTLALLEAPPRGEGVAEAHKEGKGEALARAGVPVPQLEALLLVRGEGDVETETKTVRLTEGEPDGMCEMLGGAEPELQGEGESETRPLGVTDCEKLGEGEVVAQREDEGESEGLREAAAEADAAPLALAQDEGGPDAEKEAVGEVERETPEALPLRDAPLEDV
jgi:hypothetical protein